MTVADRSSVGGGGGYRRRGCVPGSDNGAEASKSERIAQKMAGCVELIDGMVSIECAIACRCLRKKYSHVQRQRSDSLQNNGRSINNGLDSVMAEGMVRGKWEAAFSATKWGRM